MQRLWMMRGNVRTKARTRLKSGVRLGAGLGAMVFAVAVLGPTASRAQDELPITKFLRGAFGDTQPDEGRPNVTVIERGAASDPSADDPASDRTPTVDAAVPDDRDVDWSVLNSDPPNADTDVTTLRAPRAPASAPGLDVSRTDRPDGSAAMALKRPLATPWDSKVGADVSLAAPPPTTYQPDRPLPGTVTNDNGVGGAWMSTDAPGIGTIGARVDAMQDQRKIGATFERSVPLGEALSVTVQGGYALTDNVGTVTPTGTVTAAPASAAPSRVLDSEKMVKLKILSTGTSLGAGVTSTSTDASTHRTLVAEQDLYGPLHVTGTVTDMGQADSSKSITAGFKFTW